MSRWALRVSSFYVWESSALSWILVHPHSWTLVAHKTQSPLPDFFEELRSLPYNSSLVICCCPCTLTAVLNIFVRVPSKPLASFAAIEKFRVNYGCEHTEHEGLKEWWLLDFRQLVTASPCSSLPNFNVLFSALHPGP